MTTITSKQFTDRLEQLEHLINVEYDADFKIKTTIRFVDDDDLINYDHNFDINQNDVCFEIRETMNAFHASYLIRFFIDYSYFFVCDSKTFDKLECSNIHNLCDSIDDLRKSAHEFSEEIDQYFSEEYNDFDYIELIDLNIF